MRVLLLNDRIPPESRGGAGQVVWRLACGLRDAGHDVHVCAATENTPFETVREGIPTYHIAVNYPMRWHGWLSLYNPVVNRPLRTLYRRLQPDLIHAHNIHAYLTYYSLVIASQMAIPTVFTSHDVMPFAYHKMRYCIDPTYCGVRSVRDYRLPPLFNLKQMRLRYNPLRNLTIRHILTHHADGRNAPSQALCDAHAANDLPPFVPIHNGIDPTQFQAATTQVQALRQRLGLMERKVILFAGRLTAAKGTAQLLAALQQVVNAVPHATLLVLSSVPIAEQLQDHSYHALAEKHIVSGGWLAGDDLAAAFQLADVMVAPSVIFDTFPTVNLEAMATHTVALSTCYGGSREVILDGETGYIINPYDTDTFAQRLITMLSDDILRHTFAARAYQRLLDHFTLGHYVQSMLDYYQHALECKKPC